MTHCYWCNEANPNLFPMRVTSAEGKCELVQACANCCPQCVYTNGYSQCTEPQHPKSNFCQGHALEFAKEGLRESIADQDWDCAESYREDIVTYGGAEVGVELEVAA